MKRIRADKIAPGNILHLGTKLKTVKSVSNVDEDGNGYVKVLYTNGDADTYRNEDTILISDKKVKII